jgi:hypothetical protein
MGPTGSVICRFYFHEKPGPSAALEEIKQLNRLRAETTEEKVAR